jgi:F-type H+-transporting ATPase subunit gamma
MPNLKIVAMRLKSVTNIQKITQSMKMVSAAKYARAERDLKAARPLGEAAGHFYTQAEVGSRQTIRCYSLSPQVSCDKESPKVLYVAMTSDRGLAGGVHSSISKTIRNELAEKTQAEVDNSIIICVGDKSRAFMQRYFPKNLIMVGSEIGRLPPQVPCCLLPYRCIPN